MSQRIFLAALMALACTSAMPAQAPIPDAAARPMPRDRDILVVFDVSKAGMDPWPDPDFPREPGTYLIHEVRAARLFLEKLDRNGAAVGFAAFAGDVPRKGETPKPAWTVAPLTQDAYVIDRSLTALAAREPAGNSHLAAGVDQGTIELVPLRGAQSVPRLGARTALVVFNEGLPNLPHGPNATHENFAAVKRALNRAQRAGIEVYLVAFGRDAGSLEGVGEEVVSTGGAYVRADTPQQLRDEMIRLAQRLSPTGPPPPEPPDPFAALVGRWGYTSPAAENVLECSENPHTISFSDDRKTLFVQFEHPVERKGMPLSRERSYAVIEQRSNFLRIRENEPAQGEDAMTFAVEARESSYCLGDLCRERCP